MSVNDSAPATIAFYAPLKPVDHPTPSGDRHIARLFVQALKHAGYRVEIASNFRSIDIKGDASRQKRLQSIGNKIALRLIARYKKLPQEERPRAWFTYHLYHKAPDWLGPLICDELGIPYVIAEASYAAKQINGPWHIGLCASANALHRADCIFCINPVDIAGVKSLIPSAPVKALKLFLDTRVFTSENVDREALGRAFSINTSPCWLICVAMMRPGDKFKSYAILAASLRKIMAKNYRLLIIGNGEAQCKVRELFAGLPGVHFLDEQEAVKIRELLAASDLFVWPAVNEALGMALLEAQACGTAVLSGDEGGIASITSDQYSAILVKPRNIAVFSDALGKLIANPEKLQLMGKYAATYVQQHHSLKSAADILRNELERLLE